MTARTTPEERLASIGLVLPDPPEPVATYVQARVAGGLVFTAGQVPMVAGHLLQTGKLGADVSVEEGIELARTAALNVLAVAKGAVGELRRLRAVAKITVFVSSAPGFTDQHIVANGASELFAMVFGQEGIPARSAVGMAVLPMDSPVEVEAVFELDL